MKPAGSLSSSIPRRAETNVVRTKSGQPAATVVPRKFARGQCQAVLPCSLTAFSMPGAAFAKSCAFITGENVTLAL